MSRKPADPRFTIRVSAPRTSGDRGLCRNVMFVVVTARARSGPSEITSTVPIVRRARGGQRDVLICRCANGFPPAIDLAAFDRGYVRFPADQLHDFRCIPSIRGGNVHSDELLNFSLT